MGPLDLVGHMGKYFHEPLQILLNWDENLRINTYKDLSFLLLMLLVRILAWMAISDMPDDELEIDFLNSLKPLFRLKSRDGSEFLSYVK